MFKNDERYWDINLLNKWFAISSVVFLIVMVWVFIDDNDDEFKEYQKEYTGQYEGNYVKSYTGQYDHLWSGLTIDNTTENISTIKLWLRVA